MGGSSNNQAGGPAPIPILQAETQSFGQVPWPNVNAAPGNAWNDIAGLNTNPAAQYGQFPGYGSNLGAVGNATVGNALPWGTTAFNSGNIAGSVAAPWGTQAFNSGAQAGASALPWGQQAFTSGDAAAGTGANVYNQLNPYANQALSTGFNQNNALYNKLYQQNQDQTRANEAAAGVATTPYGASLDTQSSQDFNAKWNQFLSGQEAQAANTASTLDTTSINALLGGVGARQAGQGLGANILSGLTGVQQAGQGLGANILSGLTGVQQAGQGLGANIASGLTGAGGNALTQGLSVGQGIDTQQFNAQQAQIQDYINYLLGSGSNAAQYLGLANNTFGLGVNQAGITSGADIASNAALGNDLAGLGSLAGGVGRLGLASAAFT